MNKKKRVLITTYQSAFLEPGGGEVEYLNLVNNLKRVGIEADIYGSTSMRIDSYDIILHFSVNSESYSLINSIKSRGKKIMLWPNLWWIEDPNQDEIENAKAFFMIADNVIFKSVSECKNITKFVHVEEEKILIVPWGIDESFLKPADNRLFKDLYSVDKYILWLGVIERIKNQLSVINALKGFEIPLVFIGFNKDPDYFAECRSKASSTTLFLPYMQQKSDILRSAMQNCTVYIELSKDPAGLSALEAAVCERPIILTDNEWSREEFGNKAVLVNPLEESEIVHAVNKVLNGNYSIINKNKIIKKHLLPDNLNTLADYIRSID